MEKPRQVTVVVEGKDYVCDFEKLSELSDHFRRLFESDFKEGRSNRVVLENITIEVFNVIFSYMNRQEIGDKSMITEYLQSLTVDTEGEDNVGSSEKRIVKVLLSFDFLLIEPLVKICEKFIQEVMTEENFERFIDEFEEQKLPDPTRLMCFCFLRFSNLMSMTIREKLLCFSAEQLCLLVNDHSLNAEFEDMVVDSILDWVGCHKRQVESGESKTCNTGQKSENKQEEEKQGGDCWKIHLTELFKAARILLVSRNCLNELLEKDLVKGCPEAKDVVLNAISYQENKRFRHKCWPSGALHRACSVQEHVIVYLDNHQVKMYRLDENDDHVICDTSELLQAICCNEGKVFAVFDNSLYLGIMENSPTYPTDNYLHVYRLSEAKQWDKIGTFSYIPHPHAGKKNMWIPQGDHLYLLSNYFRPDSSLAPELFWIDGNIPVFNEQLSSVVPLLDTILFIFHESGKVVAFNPGGETSTNMGKFPGSPSTSISFYLEENLYILQEDGALWSVHMANFNTNKDIFRLQGNLWEGGRTLHGAICYRKKLLIFGSLDPNHLGHEDSTELTINCLPNIEKVRMINISCSDSQCLPMIVPKSWAHDNLHPQ